VRCRAVGEFYRKENNKGTEGSLSENCRTAADVEPLGGMSRSRPVDRVRVRP